MKAKVNFDGNWLSDIEFKSHRFPIQERFKKSLKTFFIFFGAATVSVLIPVLHFFLVPVFLILSIFLSYRKFKEIFSVNLEGVKCPECNTNLKDSAVGLRIDDLVVRLSCDQCRKNLTLVFEDRGHELSKI